MRIRLAPQARADLDEIWLYIARESGSIPTATRLVNTITDKFNLLAQYPFVDRSLESSQRPNIHTFAAGNYLIFYNPRQEELRILRILHTSRDAYAVFSQE